ncbi:MAG: cytochrome c-type biogenesis protein [Pseudomonadota bacterium]
MLCVFLMPVLTMAAFDVYQFETEQQEKRFHSLTHELRCPKCQNQSLAGSDSELAQDLRAIVYEMIIAGKTDDDILQFMHQRYGDFILYRPPVEPRNYPLWFGPFVILLLGVLALVFIVRRQKKNSAQPMTEEEKTRLDQLTQEMKGKN